jgi:hypothetical protein
MKMPEPKKYEGPFETQEEEDASYARSKRVRERIKKEEEEAAEAKRIEDEKEEKKRKKKTSDFPICD